MKRLMLFFSFVIALSACNTGKTIDGNSEEVKKLVVELATNEMRNQAVPALIQHLYSTHASVWGYPTYSQLKNDTENERAQHLIDVLDERIESLGIQVTNIRTTEIKKEYNMVTCEALIKSIDSDLYNITYSAQLTDDKESFVVKILKMTPIMN